MNKKSIRYSSSPNYPGKHRLITILRLTINYYILNDIHFFYTSVGINPLCCLVLEAAM